MLSKLWQSATRLGRPERKVRPARRDVLQLRPLPNPALDWYEEEGRVVLHVKRVRNWKTRLLDIFLPLPGERRIVLDAIGTDVWQLMDGRQSIGSIARALAGKYKLTPREAELSLQQFFKELSRRGYVGFTTAESSKKNRKSGPQE